jgi:hypothetical protein
VLAAGSTTHSGKIRLRHPETVEYQHEWLPLLRPPYPASKYTWTCIGIQT